MWAAWQGWRFNDGKRDEREACAKNVASGKKLLFYGWFFNDNECLKKNGYTYYWVQAKIRSFGIILVPKYQCKIYTRLWH